MEKDENSRLIDKILHAALIAFLILVFFLVFFGWAPAIIFGRAGRLVYGAAITVACLAAPAMASFFLFKKTIQPSVRFGVIAGITFLELFYYNIFGQAGYFNLAPVLRRLVSPAGFDDTIRIDFLLQGDDFFTDLYAVGLLGEIKLAPEIVFLAVSAALILYTVLIAALGYGAARLAGIIPARRPLFRKLVRPLVSAGILSVFFLVGFLFLSNENGIRPIVFPAVSRLLYPGQTLSLIEAVRRGKLDFAEKLIREGADILGKNAAGENALTAVGKVGNREAMTFLTRELAKTHPEAETLYRRGYLFTEDEFVRAIREDDREAAGLFLKGRIRLNPSGENDVYCPLARALDFDRVAIAELLLANGARIDACAGQGQYLIVAADKNRGPMIAMLLRYGADVNGTDPLGRSALLAAAETGRAELVSLLLDHGADARHKNRNDEHAALLAGLNLYRSPDPSEKNPYFQIIRRLGNKGVDLDLQNKQGWTLLMCGAAYGHLPLVTYLLEKKVNVNSFLFEPNQTGNSALQMARKHKSKALVELLIAAGAKD